MSCIEKCRYSHGLDGRNVMWRFFPYPDAHRSLCAGLRFDMRGADRLAGQRPLDGRVRRQLRPRTHCSTTTPSSALRSPERMNPHLLTTPIEPALCGSTSASTSAAPFAKATAANSPRAADAMPRPRSVFETPYRTSTLPCVGAPLNAHPPTTARSPCSTIRNGSHHRSGSPASTLAEARRKTKAGGRAPEWMSPSHASESFCSKIACRSDKLS